MNRVLRRTRPARQPCSVSLSFQASALLLPPSPGRAWEGACGRLTPQRAGFWQQVVTPFEANTQQSFKRVVSRMAYGKGGDFSLLSWHPTLHSKYCNMVTCPQTASLGYLKQMVQVPALSRSVKAAPVNTGKTAAVWLCRSVAVPWRLCPSGCAAVWLCPCGCVLASFYL